MKVLVTGGAGFIGSHVVDALVDAGHSVTVVDNLSSGRKENIDHRGMFKLDIRNVYDLSELFRSERPDVVLHLAAQPSIGESIKRSFEDLGINGMGTLNVIHAAQESGVRRIVFASTSAVYPSDARVCMEALGLCPDSPYGVSKMAAENYLRLFGNATVLRLGNVYGPRQVPLGENQVVPKMIEHLMYREGEPFTIHGDGLQTRDFVYVEDVARAFLGVMYEEGFRKYNIASGRNTSVNFLAERVAHVFGMDGYEWKHDEQRDPRRNVNMMVDQAKWGFNWFAQTGLDEGLKKTVEWWRERESIRDQS